MALDDLPAPVFLLFDAVDRERDVGAFMAVDLRLDGLQVTTDDLFLQRCITFCITCFQYRTVNGDDRSPFRIDKISFGSSCLQCQVCPARKSRCFGIAFRIGVNDAACCPVLADPSSALSFVRLVNGSVYLHRVFGNVVNGDLRVLQGTFALRFSFPRFPIDLIKGNGGAERGLCQFRCFLTGSVCGCKHVGTVIGERCGIGPCGIHLIPFIGLALLDGIGSHRQDIACTHAVCAALEYQGCGYCTVTDVDPVFQRDRSSACIDDLDFDAVKCRVTGVGLLQVSI